MQQHPTWRSAPRASTHLEERFICGDRERGAAGEQHRLRQVAHDARLENARHVAQVAAAAAVEGPALESEGGQLLHVPAGTRGQVGGSVGWSASARLLRTIAGSQCQNLARATERWRCGRPHSRAPHLEGSSPPAPPHRQPKRPHLRPASLASSRFQPCTATSSRLHVSSFCTLGDRRGRDRGTLDGPRAFASAVGAGSSAAVAARTA